MKKVIGILILVVLSVPSIANATTWYVDNAASGAKNGTSWTDAWQSFASVVWGGAGIVAGDTLFISGGSGGKVYNEALIVGANGSLGNPILIMPGVDSGHEGLVTVSNGTGSGIYINGNSYITISGEKSGQIGFRVTGCADAGISIANDVRGIIIAYLEVDNNGDASGVNQDGILMNLSATDEESMVEVRYSKIHDNWQDGLHIVGLRGPNRYGRIKIHHNEIYNISDDGMETGIRGMDIYENVMHTLINGKGKGHPDGIVTMAGYARVFNNTIYNFQDEGKVNFTNAYLYPNLYSGTPVAECCVRIYNNLLYQTTPPWTGNWARGIDFDPQGSITAISDILIANNTIVGMPAWAAALDFSNFSGSQINDFYFLNNILHNNFRLGGGTAVYIGGPSSGSFSVGSFGDSADVIFDYNIVGAGSSGTTSMAYKGAISNYTTWKTNTGCQDNINGTPDPLLSPSYKPTSMSPAVNSGLDLTLYFNEDKDGNPRGIGLWDIGAYEYDVVPPAPPVLNTPQVIPPPT